jgi:hypothetical protein
LFLFLLTTVAVVGTTASARTAVLVMANQQQK